QRPGCDVEDVHVRAAAIQVAAAVALELDAVDDPGLRAVAVRGGVRARLLLVFRGADQQREPLAVRRPLEPAHTLLHVRQLLRLAAAAVEHPDLRLAAVAGGEEAEPAAVRAPLRIRGRDALRRQRQRLASGGGRHPDARLAAVLLLE